MNALILMAVYVVAVFIFEAVAIGIGFVTDAELKRPSAEGVENCRAGRAKGRESDATLSAVGVFFQKID